MARRYESYLLRSWRWTDGSQRMVIEHVQSGMRAVVASPSDAVAWIADQTSLMGEGQSEKTSPSGSSSPSPALITS